MTCPSDVEVFDLTHLQPYDAPNTRRHNGGTLRRAPEDVTVMMIHQTACMYGVAKYQLRAAGGDADEAQRQRALNVKAHTVSFAEGWVVHAHPVLSYVYHGGDACSCSVGLEIEGLYPGLLDDPSTVPREDLLTTWGPREADELTELAIMTGRKSMVSLAERCWNANARLDTAVGHRQSSATRQADPGEGIWKEIVEVMAPKLGLKLDYDRTWGTGRPIPRAWSGVGHALY